MDHQVGLTIQRERSVVELAVTTKADAMPGRVDPQRMTDDTVLRLRR